MPGEIAGKTTRQKLQKPPLELTPKAVLIRF